MGEATLRLYPPREGERVAEKDDPAEIAVVAPGLVVPQSFRVDLDVDTHQVRRCVWAVHVSDPGVGRLDLQELGVSRHLDVVEDSLCEEDPQGHLTQGEEHQHR